MSKKFIVDRELQKLACGIRVALESNQGLIGDQQDQVERLFKCEKRFRNEICKYSKSKDAYLRFIDHVNKELGNILSAQTYFRETSNKLRAISSAIRTKDTATLMDFDINYQMAKFLVDNY